VSAPRSTHRLAVVVAYATFVLVGVSAGVGGLLLPAQIRDYGVDKATIGITFITFSAGFLLAGVTAGRLIHRWGVRLALVVGGTAFLLSGLYTAVRPPFLALVAVQVAAGYGVGMLESVMNAYLSGLPRAAILLNRLHAFFGVGALLGRQAAWPPGRYSCLAGFVEPGESAEAAVAREVAEEVGIAVRDIRYVASQPWPFPGSLMLGFTAVGDPSSPLVVDGMELAEAGWYSREELSGPNGPRLPPPASIARYIIDGWLSGNAS